MTTTLDEVEALEQREAARTQDTWRELVAAYVAGQMPTAQEVADILRASGKGRKDLERDGALLRMYQRLQSDAARIPATVAALNALGTELHSAIEAREAAEKAIAAAQLRVSAIDSDHTLTGHTLRQLRRSEAQLKDPQFAPVIGGDRTPQTVQQLKAEIAAIETRLQELVRLVESKEQSLTTYDAERDSICESELARVDKAARIAELSASYAATARMIDRHQGEQHSLTQDLAAKRRLLKSLIAN